VIPRLAELRDRYSLPSSAADSLQALLDLLAADTLAPTAITSPKKAVDEHVADSLVALELDLVRAARSIADLGAGAGFPGLVLAIALPETEVALVESNGRKCEFIARAAEAAGCVNARVVNRRAEDWPEGIARFDVVTARAVGSLPLVMEYAAPLLRIGGALVAWRGRRDPAEEAAAERAAGQLALSPLELRPVRPFDEAVHRHLHVATKAGETPPSFPRRPGAARKRPLGRELPSDRRRR
jgi:16S rRNA (guanine527-N7)-methyltransferase